MFTDLVAVLRLAPLAVGWPSVYRYVRREVGEVTEVFARTVEPLVVRSIDRPRRRQEVSRILLSTGVKVCLAMSGYAQAAGDMFHADLAMLGSSFTRVYDDLFDNFRSPQLDERLRILFEGGPFQPLSDAESLLLALYRTIETRLGGTDAEPVFTALRHMHRYQVESRQQLTPTVTGAELRRITRGKGGYGTIALFGLLRPALPPTTQRLLMELGDILQVLDDFHDISMDRVTGIQTEAILGTVTSADVSRRINELHRDFRRQFPDGDHRRLFGMMFMLLARALIHQLVDLRRPCVRGSAGPGAGPGSVAGPGSDADPGSDAHKRRPHRLLFRPAGNIHPEPDTHPEPDQRRPEPDRTSEAD